MKRIYIWWRILALVIATASAAPAAAQVVAGHCDTMEGRYLFYSNGGVAHASSPNARYPTLRDGSGQTFLEMPSRIPGRRLFVAWSGDLLQIDPGQINVVGQCAFPLLQPPPPVFMTAPVQPNFGLALNNGQFLPIPQAMATPNSPYGYPLYVTEAEAIRCAGGQRGGQVANQDTFETCMVNSMLGKKELAAYKCAQDASDEIDSAFCMAGVLGGTKEQRIALRLKNCYAQYGSNWRQYPLCLAADELSQDQARLLNCVAQQYEQRGSVDIMSTAFCYGADRIKLNTEMQIIAGCAASTGGQPKAFVACAGGQLTAIELNKCYSNGVGGPDGCFGPNNTIVQSMSLTGNYLAQVFGPNNDLVRAYRTVVEDIVTGRMTAREGTRALQNTLNKVERASSNVLREANRAGENVSREAERGFQNVGKEAERFVKRLGF